MKFYELPDQLKKLNRIRQICFVLGKGQAGSALRSLNPFALFARLAGKRQASSQAMNRARLVRKTLEELGTTYIKFGQWLSVRPDFVPMEVLHELEKLQDRLPPVPFKIIRRAVEAETKKSLEEVFSSFDQQPLSTASIAQVHRAVLRSGEQVAVKVQHPGLRSRIRSDLGVLDSLATWGVKNWPRLSLYNPEAMLSTFEAILMDEVDFTVEAGNQERLAKQFADTPSVCIPRVFWQYTTPRLLVMEFLEGLKLAQRESFAEWGLDPRVLSRRLSDCLFVQQFEHGFAHSDPHPGNLLFMKGNRIGLVDFGIVLNLSGDLLDRFLDWFYAVIYRDLDLLERTFLEVATPLAPIDRIEFRKDCLDYMDEMHYQPVNRISFAKVLERINRILYRNKISMPSNFLFFFKSLSTAEGVVRRLDPEFDWREEWGPKIRKLIQGRLAPGSVAAKYRKLWRDYDHLATSYPDDFREIVRKIKEGRLEIDLSPRVLDMVVQLTEALRKLAVSVVTAAVIVGLFHLLRDRDLFFGAWLAEVWRDSWWYFGALALVLYYLRRK